MDKILAEIGLSEGEILVYTSLLDTPEQTAQQLASRTSIGRTNIYRILDTLESQKLISADSSPVKKFSLCDPDALKSIIRQKQLDIKTTSEALTSALPLIRSQYALTTGKPGVIHVSGDDGFLQSTEATIRSKTEVLLFASDYVPTDAVTLRRFREVLLQRKEAGVHTRAIFHSSQDNPLFKKIFLERGIEVKFIESNPFAGEVSIYENNVVFVTYTPNTVTTVVTSEPIAETMRTVFEQVWISAKP